LNGIFNGESALQNRKMINSIFKKVVWWIAGIMCVGVGLYPVMYLLADEEIGILTSKTQVLLSNTFWNIGFYGHIIFGGLALAVGWMQFSKNIRLKRIKAHRLIGKIYVFSVLISGTCAVGIGFFATGGVIASTGFISLGLIWLASTAMAYSAIQRGQVNRHQRMMVYSYAACFAAVTLRIYLPLLIAALGEFNSAYRIVAWLCWVPNIIVAFFITRKMSLKLEMSS
jgi:uncharacterized membrane protein